MAVGALSLYSTYGVLLPSIINLISQKTVDKPDKLYFKELIQAVDIVPLANPVHLKVRKKLVCSAVELDGL